MAPPDVRYRRWRQIGFQRQFGWSGKELRKPQLLPERWRERLPEAMAYYAGQIRNLRKKDSGWAIGCCPFHDDRVPSMRVRVSGGGTGVWRCFAGCGSGDLVAFHMRRTGMDFIEAVQDLIGGSKP